MLAQGPFVFEEHVMADVIADLDAIGAFLREYALAASAEEVAKCAERQVPSLETKIGANRLSARSWPTSASSHEGPCMYELSGLFWGFLKRNATVNLARDGLILN